MIFTYLQPLCRCKYTRDRMFPTTYYLLHLLPANLPQNGDIDNKFSVSRCTTVVPLPVRPCLYVFFCVGAVPLVYLSPSPLRPSQTSHLHFPLFQDNSACFQLVVRAEGLDQVFVLRQNPLLMPRQHANTPTRVPLATNILIMTKRIHRRCFRHPSAELCSVVRVGAM